MCQNLEVLVLYQFGDYIKCVLRFCGYKRKLDEIYLYKSLFYKILLSDLILKEKFYKIFEFVIVKVLLYSDLGFS